MAVDSQIITPLLIQVVQAAVLVTELVQAVLLSINMEQGQITKVMLAVQVMKIPIIQVAAAVALAQ